MNINEFEPVTKESQHAHIVKIKHIATKLNETMNSSDLPTITVHLSQNELDTIQRALACHMAVITLDMERDK